MDTDTNVPGTAPPHYVIPRPSPRNLAVFEDTDRNCVPFLRAAGIEKKSERHKELKKTIWALHHQYLHPFKCTEEQVDRVDQLITKARVSIPWLNQYEDAWPARVYLKRYVDTKRPHLMRTRHAHKKKAGVQKPQISGEAPRNFQDPDNILRDQDSTVRDFLGSLTPSLDHHLDAFVELGVKDQKTLQAFLSWPQVIQAQFLDESHGVLQLTSLEKKGLLWRQNTVILK